MTRPRSRVAFVMCDPDGGAFSLASVRRELLMPTQALGNRGIRTHLIDLCRAQADDISQALEDADWIVFGKVLWHPSLDGNEPFRFHTGAYLELLSRLERTKRLVFCLSDDHFDAPRFADFYRRAAGISRLWMVPSETMRERMQRQTDCPVGVYPEPAESSYGLPRVPRRGLRERAAIWIARRAQVPLDPWRLRLLWFGHMTNARSILEVLPELRALAREVPILLECVSGPGSGLQSQVTRPRESGSAALRIIFTPWSLEYMGAALQACDAVILPQASDDPKKRAKSSNRLVDAVHAGRFVVAHPIPSYQDFARFAWVGNSIGDGLRWLLGHPREALRRLEAGQAYIARHHSMDALAESWLKALDIEAHSEVNMPSVRA